jgi:hypothetical protein
LKLNSGKEKLSEILKYKTKIIVYIKITANKGEIKA